MAAKSRKQGSAFISELTHFLKFLQTLWGILAGISVLFPLSNVLLKLLPLDSIYSDPPGSLLNLSPSLITTLSTIATLFVVLSTFRKRHLLKTEGEMQKIQRKSWWAFGIGAACLLLYFIVYYGIYGVFYGPFSVSGGDPRGLIGDFLILIFYSGFFVFLTRAFVLLAMSEYFRKAGV